MSIPIDSLIFEYSPDQQFIAIVNPSSLFIYDEKTKNLTQTISTNSTKGRMTTLTFSLNSKYLAIGYNAPVV
jgi:hypothetical protein